jgi:hypothetical protein
LKRLKQKGKKLQTRSVNTKREKIVKNLEKGKIKKRRNIFTQTRA